MQTLKGFRDFLSSDMLIRNEAKRRIISVFEKYGFEEIQTPALEYQEVLLGKYGKDPEKLMYLFEDQGGRKVGLRYDLTVPLTRFVENNRNLNKPLKLYRIQPVWRAENPQKGRYREFYQCDFDIVGSPSPLADAEIISILNEAFLNLGFIAFKIRLNSRTILTETLKKADIPNNLHVPTLTAVDKLDKRSQAEVEKELSDKGLSKKQIDDLFETLKSNQPDESLKEVIKYATQLGVLRNLVFDPFLVRGLDYYTGAIFEVVVEKPAIGSLAGGGRYDNLIKNMGGPDLEATGSTIGLDRITDAITEENLWKNLQKTSVKVLVTIFSPDLVSRSIEVAKLLRVSGIAAEIYPNEKVNIKKQLKYASDKQIPYAVIIGPNEAIKNMVVIKDLSTKKQETTPSSALLTLIK